MQSQPPVQENKDLIAKGKALYGLSFIEIYDAFLKLQPFMTNIVGCLEALVNRQPMSGASRKEELEQAGYDLAESLANKASWAQHQANRYRIIKVCQEAIGDLVQETFNNHGLAQLPLPYPADPYLVEWPPDRQHTQFGKRPYTGQTEQPGSKPGYDSSSLPPR